MVPIVKIPVKYTNEEKDKIAASILSRLRSQQTLSMDYYTLFDMFSGSKWSGILTSARLEQLIREHVLIHLVDNVVHAVPLPTPKEQMLRLKDKSKVPILVERMKRDNKGKPVTVAAFCQAVLEKFGIELTVWQHIWNKKSVEDVVAVLFRGQIEVLTNADKISYVCARAATELRPRCPVATQDVFVPSEELEQQSKSAAVSATNSPSWAQVMTGSKAAKATSPRTPPTPDAPPSPVPFIQEVPLEDNNRSHLFANSDGLLSYTIFVVTDLVQALQVMEHVAQCSEISVECSMDASEWLRYIFIGAPAVFPRCPYARVYIFELASLVHDGLETVQRVLSSILNNQTLKLIYDCKRVVRAFHFQLKIAVSNYKDLQIQYATLLDMKEYHQFNGIPLGKILPVISARNNPVDLLTALVRFGLDPSSAQVPLPNIVPSHLGNMAACVWQLLHLHRKLTEEITLTAHGFVLGLSTLQAHYPQSLHLALDASDWFNQLKGLARLSH